jgi:hypothetical protein
MPTSVENAVGAWQNVTPGPNSPNPKPAQSNGSSLTDVASPKLSLFLRLVSECVVYDLKVETTFSYFAYDNPPANEIHSVSKINNESSWSLEERENLPGGSRSIIRGS